MPADEEEIVIAQIENKARERPFLGSVPYISEQELEEGRLWTLQELGELLSDVAPGWEEVSYAMIPLVGDLKYTHARSLQIMFIGVAWASNPQELQKFDPLLEGLNYNELNLGIRRCMAMLERRPDIKNLTELFQQSARRVQRMKQIAPPMK